MTIKTPAQMADIALNEYALGEEIEYDDARRIIAAVIEADRAQREPRYVFTLGYDDESGDIDGQDGAWFTDIWDRHELAGGTSYFATREEALIDLARLLIGYPDHEIVEPEVTARLVNA